LGRLGVLCRFNARVLHSTSTSDLVYLAKHGIALSKAYFSENTEIDAAFDWSHLKRKIRPQVAH